MNIEQLKKQAKNLRKIFPHLVAKHGDSLTLAQAQGVIAQLNGFPSWECMCQAQSATTPITPHADLIQNGLYFAVDDDAEELPIAFSSKTGETTRFEWAHQAILSFHRDEDEAKVNTEDRELYDYLEQQAPNAIDRFQALSKPGLEALELRIRTSLKRAPLNIEGHSLLAGTLFTLGRYNESLAVSEPVITTLIGLLPTDRKVQASYSFLDNRPFFRLLNVYLLALHELGRHPEANKIAKLALQLCPNDNLGFRYLKSKALRTARVET